MKLSPINTAAVAQVRPSVQTQSIISNQSASKLKENTQYALPLHIPMMTFGGREDKENLMYGDIIKALDKKMRAVDVVKRLENGKPVVENLIMEDGTVLRKITRYDMGITLIGFELSDITGTVNNPGNGKPHSIFNYRQGIEGCCFVSLLNEKNEQYHGFYMETKLC